MENVRIEIYRDETDVRIGTIWKGENGWEAESEVTGNCWDFIDTIEEAIELLQDEAANAE